MSKESIAARRPPQYLSNHRSGPTFGFDLAQNKTNQGLVGHVYRGRVGVALWSSLVFEAGWSYSDAKGEMMFDQTLSPSGTSSVNIRASGPFVMVRYHPFKKWFFIRGGFGYQTFISRVYNIVYDDDRRNLQIKGTGECYLLEAGFELAISFVGIGIFAGLQEQHWQSTSMTANNGFHNGDTYPLKRPWKSQHVGIAFSFYL